MPVKVPKVGDTVYRKYLGGDQAGTETAHLVLETKNDPTENKLSISVSVNGERGWVLWQPEEGQWRI